MSRYTTQIRFLVENGFKFKLDKYPIFDEDYRETLNQFIIDYYYMYEIEFETAALFNHYLDVTMRAIMPKYNMLYQQQKKLLSEVSIEVVETFTATNSQDRTNTSLSDSDINTNSSSQTSSKSDSSDENRFSNTPMNNIANLDNYLTNASRDKSNASDSSDSSSNSKTNTKSTGSNDEKLVGENDYTKKLLDPMKAFDVLKSIKDNFVNIDYEIVQELDKLFFKMW